MQPLLKTTNYAPQEISATWPDLTAGTGWRWEIGNTQQYDNTVKIESLDGGERICVYPSKRTNGSPIAVQLHQINDPGWRPSGNETLELGWKQAGETPSYPPSSSSPATLEK